MNHLEEEEATEILEAKVVILGAKVEHKLKKVELETKLERSNSIKVQILKEG